MYFNRFFDGYPELNYNVWHTSPQHIRPNSDQSPQKSIAWTSSSSTRPHKQLPNPKLGLKPSPRLDVSASYSSAPRGPKRPRYTQDLSSPRQRKRGCFDRSTSRDSAPVNCSPSRVAAAWQKSHSQSIRQVLPWVTVTAVMLRVDGWKMISKV